MRHTATRPFLIFGLVVFRGACPLALSASVTNGKERRTMHRQQLSLSQGVGVVVTPTDRLTYFAGTQPFKCFVSIAR